MTFDREKCCGCAACVCVCPAGAIRWGRNREGFYEPRIDGEKCTDCGLCRKVCPYEEDLKGKDADPLVFAAVHKDREVVRHSSSGGAFTALSDWILGQKGVVYGVKFDDDLRAVYGRAETKEERDAFCGSKYVQADGAGVYPQITADLKEGRTVMFTGTPCQTYGLRKYLEIKKANTKNLYLCDNVCHGAASPKVWQVYLDYIRGGVLKGGTIRSFTMRSKKEKWQKQMIGCETEMGDESRVLNSTASWNKLYSSTAATRRSCYQCRFTSYLRRSDITLADYWNIENAGLSIDYTNGVSLLLINTKKGSRWLESCRGDLTLQESSKKACWQMHLEKPVVCTKKRKQFWQDFQTEPKDTVKKYAKGSLFHRAARMISPALRKLGLYTAAVRILSRVKGHAE